MPVRTRVSWNTMVSGFSSNFDCDKVFWMFSRMEKKGLEPNSVTWTSLLSSFARCGFEDVFEAEGEGETEPMISIGDYLKAYFYSFYNFLLHSCLSGPQKLKYGKGCSGDTIITAKDIILATGFVLLVPKGIEVDDCYSTILLAAMDISFDLTELRRTPIAVQLREQNITGIAETPFLIGRVNELMGGASLASYGASLLVAIHAVRKGAATEGMKVRDYVWRGHDPTSVAVMIEEVEFNIFRSPVAALATTIVSDNNRWVSCRSPQPSAEIIEARTCLAPATKVQFKSHENS
ncbi:Uncharacterized protein Fot_39740 [Forsythia ovata]|uniref:Uncharacterized protein n=1 Tax=Forsythia ovata TaxID=205694 RepID=A0ABD1S802_9LAMI